MTLPVSAHETEQKITSAGAATESKKPKVKQGAYWEKGKFYYYKNGKKQYNYFRKIKGEYYYFGSKGYAVKYTIHIDGKLRLFDKEYKMVTTDKERFVKVGNRSYYLKKDDTVVKGWFIASNGKLYYASRATGQIIKGHMCEGIRLGDKTGAAQASPARDAKMEVIRALEKITTPNMTKAQKLRAAWNYVVGGRFYYMGYYPNLNQTGWQHDITNKMFKYGGGNCYGFASVFAAFARQIGYNPYIVCGRVPGSRDGASDRMTRHAWVRINGANYDPEAHYAGWARGIYGYGYYPMTHQIQRIVSFSGL